MAKATDAQVASFGHVAARLRAFLAEKQWKPSDLNAAVGVQRSNTAIYTWLSAKGAPGPKAAARLAKVIGCSPQELQERGSVDVVVPVTTQLVQTKPRIPAEVLSFVGTDDGLTRIRLDVTMPYDQGVPVFRMLLDAGLIATRGAAED